jgi:hypothetical protein
MTSGERIKVQFEEELDAGRRSLVRERTQEFDEEQDAGRRSAARARARLEEEQNAGRHTARTRW